MYQKRLEQHPATAEIARLREVAKQDVMDQLKTELGADLRAPVPARIVDSRMRNRLLQNAQPTRQSIKRERERMTAQRPWLARYTTKIEHLIRLYRRRETLEATINEEGLWLGNQRYWAMLLNLEKIIQTEERDLALTPVHEAAMRQAVVHTETDLASLLSKARNGNAIEDKS